MKKTKFSAIDVLIIAVLAAVIIFGFVKMKDIISNKASAQTVHFSFLATSVNEGCGSLVSVGDEVSISLSEKAYATVTKVSETQHMESDFNPNSGEYVSSPVEGKSDVRIDLECTGTVSDTEIANGNVVLRVGNESYIHGKGYAFEGYIVEVGE